MKTNMLIFLFLSLCSILNAQEYYILEKDKKIYDKSSLENKINEMNALLRKNVKKDATKIPIAIYGIVGTSKRGDSIINKVKLSFEFIATRNEKIYSYENKPIPKFTLRNLQSKKISSNDLKGKVTVINLWFTNCFPCVKEIPILNVLQNKYKDQVRFLAITYDSKQKVKAFLKKKDFNFEQLVNAESYLRKELGNRAYPKIIILDKEGIVRYIGGGIPSKHDFETRKWKELTEKDLEYLEEILNGLI